MSRQVFGIGIAAIAAIAAVLAITGRLQKVWADVKGGAPSAPPSTQLPPLTQAEASTPDPGQAAGGASGSWGTPSTPPPASSPAGTSIKVGDVTLTLPGTLPVIDLSKLFSAGTDGAKVQPLALPASNSTGMAGMA